jgi:hypothetical protein
LGVNEVPDFCLSFFHAIYVGCGLLNGAFGFATLKIEAVGYATSTTTSTSNSSISKTPSKASQHSGGTTDQRQMLWVLFSSGDRVGLHARER